MILYHLGPLPLLNIVKYDRYLKVHLSIFIFTKIVNIVEYLNWIFKIFYEEHKYAVNIQPGIYSIQHAIHLYLILSSKRYSCNSTPFFEYPTSIFRNLVRYPTSVFRSLVRYSSSTFRNLDRCLWTPIGASPPRAWKSGLHHVHLLKAYLWWCHAQVQLKYVSLITFDQ